MAARQEPDEPSFCLEVKTKHLHNRFEFSKICPKEFRERYSEKFGLNKEDITLSSNEYDGVFVDGLEDFVDFHKIKVHDRICFKVSSKFQSHLCAYFHRSAAPPVVAKIETMSPTQCTLTMATAASAIPSGSPPMLPAVIAPPSIPRTPTLRASVPRAPLVPAPIAPAPMPSASTVPAAVVRDSTPTAPMLPNLIPRDLMPQAPILTAHVSGAPRAPAASAPIFILSASMAPNPMAPAPILAAPIASASMAPAPMAPTPILKPPILGGPMAPAPVHGAPIPRAAEPSPPIPHMAPAATAPAPMALIAPAAPTSPMLRTPPASPTMTTPPAPSVPSGSTNMNNAPWLNREKCFKVRRSNKAPQPRARSPDRTRLGSGVLRKINYCEDIPTGRSVHNRQHIDADVDEADPPEVQAHKKRVRAGCTLEQHLVLLPQGTEGADCDASVVCGSAPLSIIIEKTPTGSLAISYWVDKTFATKWRKLLIACHDKDILLSNQRGKKWRVQWNHELKEVDHTTTGWSTFVADHKLHDGDRCDLTVLHTAPVEFGFSFIRKPGSKSPGFGITSLLKDKPKEKVALEGLERGYGSEGDAIALDNRQHQYRSHFRFQRPMSDEGKFFYSSDCPGTYARITPYPKRSRRGKRFQPYKKSHPYKKSQPGTSFEPGIDVMEYIIQEFLKATSSKLVAEDMPQSARGNQPESRIVPHNV